jgi:hypothetical protein
MNDLNFKKLQQTYDLMQSLLEDCDVSQFISECNDVDGLVPFIGNRFAIDCKYHIDYLKYQQYLNHIMHVDYDMYSNLGELIDLNAIYIDKHDRNVVITPIHMGAIHVSDKQIGGVTYYHRYEPDMYYTTIPFVDFLTKFELE